MDANITVNATMVDLFPLLYKVLHLESSSDPDTSASNVLKDRNGSLSSLEILLRPPPATTGEKIKKKVNEIVDYATSPTVLPVTGN